MQYTELYKNKVIVIIRKWRPKSLETYVDKVTDIFLPYY